MKETYSKPEVYRVVLNYQQAVLAACSTTGRNTRRGTRRWCRTNRCRRGGRRRRDAGAGS